MDQQTSLPSNTQTCAECSEHPGIVFRLKKYYCKGCWIFHCNFKFRKRIYELARLVQKSSSRSSSTISLPSIAGSMTSIFGPTETVLIYYDCSPWAKALLTLVRDTILASSLETQRSKNLPLPFVFTVLYIHETVNEQGSLGSKQSSGSGTEAGNDLEELRSWLNESKSKFDLDFPLVVTSLEKSLSPSSQDTKLREIQRTENLDEGECFPFDPDLNSQLLMMVDSIKSKSSRIDFLHCLRQNLIVSIANDLNLSKVFLSDHQTTMSVKMFSMMSLGRGAQLAEQMSLITKVGLVELARPLMDLSSDDLLDYLNSLDTNKTQVRTGETKDRRIDNIRSQCEDFILTLQKDYPGTVPTLTKIGAKLDSHYPTSDEAAQVSTCRLCKHRVSLEEAIETIDFCYGCSNILKEMVRAPH